MRGIGPRKPLPSVPAASREEPYGDTCAICDRGYVAICAELRGTTTITRQRYQMEHGHLFPLIPELVIAWLHCDRCHKVGER